MKRLILFFGLGMFIACSNHQSIEIPSTILPKEKMAAILLDVHLMEASMDLAGQNPNSNILVEKGVVLNIDIMKKHLITKKQFDESFNFYTRNPELLIEVYKDILNNLSKMQAEVTNKK